jgi:hypothetical protein
MDTDLYATLGPTLRRTPGVETPPAERDILAHIVGHTSDLDAAWPANEVINLYVALKTKPFVVLTGPPEAGQRRLARRFARALVGPHPIQHQTLQAHPWWANRTGDVGHYGALQTRLNGLKFYECLQAAAAVVSDGLAFFVHLEDMSPAEVEGYFCDLPSGFHQGDGRLHLPSFTVRCPAQFPANLYVIGTLNRRWDSGYHFSQCVLTTATIIHVMPLTSAPTFAALPTSTFPPSGYQQVFVESAVRDEDRARTKLRAILGDESPAREPLKEVEWLLWAHHIELDPVALHAGLCYLANGFDGEGWGLFAPDPLTNLSTALDYVIAQEVLPRLKETLAENKTAWRELAHYLTGRYPRALWQILPARHRKTLGLG